MKKYWAQIFVLTSLLYRSLGSLVKDANNTKHLKTRKIMSLLNITFFVGKTDALKTSIYPFKTY